MSATRRPDDVDAGARVTRATTTSRAWTGRANSTELTIEQLNRRQTVNTLFFANAQSGAVRSVFVDRDSAWIDIYDDHVDWGPGPSLHWMPTARRSST